MGYNRGINLESLETNRKKEVISSCVANPWGLFQAIKRKDL
jgi:hypothetical protein